MLTRKYIFTNFSKFKIFAKVTWKNDAAEKLSNVKDKQAASKLRTN